MRTYALLLATQDYQDFEGMKAAEKEQFGLEKKLIDRWVE